MNELSEQLAALGDLPDEQFESESPHDRTAKREQWRQKALPVTKEAEPEEKKE